VRCGGFQLAFGSAGFPMSYFYHVLNNEDYNLTELADSLSTFSATWGARRVSGLTVSGLTR
jgi:hypothetical protein